MKIALVHELLTMKGGAEKVMRVLSQMFPEAPIYTLLYDEDAIGDWFPQERIRVSRLQKWTAFTTNHHFYLPFFRKAVESWDFSEYDLVISSSSAFVHGIKTYGKTKHLCYVHSPARYLWDRTHDVQERSPLRLSKLFHKLRLWDATVADRPNKLIAASKEVQRRIELYWNRESTVVHPSIDHEWFTDDGTTVSPQRHFLIVSTLANYKRIDLAIDACNQHGIHLTIVGAGQAERELRKRAGGTITFKGFLSGDALKNEYRKAKALIVPGKEDFCMTAIEAMACGTPVIGLKEGGLLETVQEGITGTFFTDQNPHALGETLRTFDRMRFDAATLKQHATDWNRETFEKKIRGEIASL